MPDFSDGMLDPSTPMSVVVDVLSDVTTMLSGEYIYLAESSSSPEEEERLIEKSFEVQDRKKATDFRDREAMVARIREFKAELKELEGR
jgi:hypothetical protein